MTRSPTHSYLRMSRRGPAEWKIARIKQAADHSPNIGLRRRSRQSFSNDLIRDDEKQLRRHVRIKAAVDALANESIALALDPGWVDRRRAYIHAPRSNTFAAIRRRARLSEC